jgi:hypothetical protein
MGRCVRHEAHLYPAHVLPPNVLRSSRVHVALLLGTSLLPELPWDSNFNNKAAIKDKAESAPFYDHVLIVEAV